MDSEEVAVNDNLNPYEEKWLRELNSIEAEAHGRTPDTGNESIVKMI